MGHRDWFERPVYLFQGVDMWDFDVFSYARVTGGSPLKYLGYHLLTSHGCVTKFKIPPATLAALLGHLEIGYAW